MTMPALSFDQVSVRREPHAAETLSGISLAVAAGERVALVGLNGSGKTTLLMSAVGLVPHQGEIRVGGVPVTARTLPQVRGQVGFLFNVPEDQLLMPRVLDDVAFGCVRQGLPPSEAAARAMQALDSLGVASLAELPVHHLSHGQKQRVALAGALVRDPPLLLLDEPSAGLDPPGKRSLASLLQGLPAAMLIATHDLEFASRVCSRLLLLDEGRLVLDCARADEVLRRWDDERCAT